jgi:hypothetical protein
MNITGSVGRGGRNGATDTRTVQTLLNPHLGMLGVRPLDVDGLCGPLTIDAITRYQTRVMKASWADGRIDPGGPTLASLNSANAPGGGAPGQQGEVTAARKIVNLTALHFVRTPVVIDPADGTAQDAYTSFDYDFPDLPARRIGSDYGFAVPNVIEIIPNAKARTGAALTPRLLAHEQFHYDVGFAAARCLAHQFTIARAKTLDDLKARYVTLIDLHFFTRAGLIQKRYDMDTAHGANAHYQTVWLDRMRACLADPDAKQIGGFWL